MFKPHKLAIIGLGHVGSAVLARAIACQLAAEIVCIDIKPEVAHGEAVDAVHCLYQVVCRRKWCLVWVVN